MTFLKKKRHGWKIYNNWKYDIFLSTMTFFSFILTPCTSGKFQNFQSKFLYKKILLLCKNKGSVFFNATYVCKGKSHFRSVLYALSPAWKNNILDKNWNFQILISDYHRLVVKKKPVNGRNKIVLSDILSHSSQCHSWCDSLLKRFLALWFLPSWESCLARYSHVFRPWRLFFWESSWFNSKN